MYVPGREPQTGLDNSTNACHTMISQFVQPFRPLDVMKDGMHWHPLSFCVNPSTRKMNMSPKKADKYTDLKTAWIQL